MGKAMTRQKNKQRQAKVNADRKNNFRAKAKAKAKAKAAAAGPAGAAAAEPHPVPKATLPVQPAGIRRNLGARRALSSLSEQVGLCFLKCVLEICVRNVFLTFIFEICL